MGQGYGVECGRLFLGQSRPRVLPLPGSILCITPNNSLSWRPLMYVENANRTLAARGVLVEGDLPASLNVAVNYEQRIMQVAAYLGNVALIIRLPAIKHRDKFGARERKARMTCWARSHW